MGAPPVDPPSVASARFAAADLSQILQSSVIPRLIALRRPASIQIGPRWVESRISDLAYMLISTQAESGFEATSVIERFYASTGSLNALCEEVLEPTARRLGDLWAADQCSEFDVTIALGRMQSGMRQLSFDEPEPAPGSLISSAAVLVAPAPCETHMFGAALNAESLWQAGCNVCFEFPKSLEELQDKVADDWLDVVDLSLSTSYRRQHWLPSLASTIAGARRASMNKAIVIIVDGRVFFESHEAFRSVGADACSASASGIVALVSKSLHAARVQRRA